MRVHLAAEHPPELELCDIRLDPIQVGCDVVERGLIVVFSGERIELTRIVNAAAEPIQSLDKGFERRALLPERLRPRLILPDARILELALNFL